MAVKFEEKDLQRRCERLLEVLITEETACTVYSAAVKHNSKVPQLANTYLRNVSHLMEHVILISLQILRDIAFNFIVPNFNAVVKTTGYKNMSEELRSRLIQELAEENVFVGLKRKFQD